MFFLQSTIQVFPAANDLIARDEQVEVAAKKDFYANAGGQNNQEKWRKIGKIVKIMVGHL